MIRRRTIRSGFSLLEVILALAIFLMSLIGLTALLNLCTVQAVEVDRINRATQLLQSTMNEVVAGAIPLSSQGESPFEEDETWYWSMECSSDSSMPDLWNVTITVSRRGSDGLTSGPWSMSQLVLDPSARGAIGASSSTPMGGP